MAISIPETIPRKATAGERLLITSLKRGLPDNCIIYYEPMIGNRKPDIVLIIPEYGVLILEVKDYRKQILKSLNTDSWSILLENGDIGEVQNPLNQARSYAFSIADRLKKDKFLLYGGTGNNLKFSYGFGTVFTRMTRLDAVTTGISEVIPDNLSLFREDIDLSEEELSSEFLWERLANMFSVVTRRMDVIDQMDIDRIRYILFPEVRIGESRTYDENNLLVFRDLVSMSLYQEQLAKQVGDGHRLIRGVSGSGKTLVLIARAKLLSRDNPNWRILFVCYGVVLSRFIRSCFPSDIYPNVHVLTFHEFVKSNFGIYSEERINRLSANAREANSIFPVYEAVFVDETQDLEASWISILAKCVSPETKSLLLAVDGAQNIFKRKTSLTNLTGLNFQGRSRVLSINYRNSKRIIEFAWDFYKNFSSNVNNDEIINPVYTTRLGTPPMKLGFKTRELESSWVSGEIFRLIQAGQSPGSIAILYKVKKYNGHNYVEELINKLTSLDINTQWVSHSRESKANYLVHDNKVNILTLDSSKGLDFKTVFIINCQNCPLPLEDDLDREVSLMYIGMTRPTDELYLTWSGSSIFTEYFENK